MGDGNGAKAQPPSNRDLGVTLWKYGDRTRRQVKDAADRKWDKARERCRYRVFTRAEGCCERCGVPLVLKPSDARHEFEIGHVNEEPPRSLGGDPLNPADCVLFCYKCHADVRRTFAIAWKDPARKALGGATFPALRPAVRGARPLAEGGSDA